MIVQEGCLGQKESSDRNSRQPNLLVLGDLRRLLSRTGNQGNGAAGHPGGGGKWELRAPNVIGAVIDMPQEVMQNPNRAHSLGDI